MSDDDWKRLTQGIKAYDKAPEHPEEFKPKHMPMHHNKQPSLRSPADTNDLPRLTCDDFSGIDAATVRKLKRGQFSISRTLDLHGLTQLEALDALESSLMQASAAGERLVLVITGKGSLSSPGILRTALPGWLNEPPLRPLVLAFTAARREDGGSGAFYVLLKRKGR